MLLCAKSNFLTDYSVSYFLLDIILIWIGLEKNRFKKSDIKLFLKFSFIYIAYVTFRYLFLNRLAIAFFVSDLNFLLKYIVLSFLYCAVLRDKAIYYIVKLTILAALISLPLYFLQLAAGDLIYSLGKLANLQTADVNSTYVTFLIFSYDKLHAIRNSGFSWEPGAYGCFLNIGLLLYLVTNNFVFNKKAIILTLAIITTLSTTSYAALIIVLLMNYRANGGKFSKYIIIGIPILIIIAVQLSFLFSKIVNTYNSDVSELSNVSKFKELNDYYLTNGGQLPLNRFASLIFIYRLFGLRLIWGISNTYSNSVSALNNVNISNGIIDFVAKFGLVGLIYLIYRYILLFKKYLLKNELIFYCVLVLLLLSFGEPMLIFQTTLAFFFLYHYADPNTDLIAGGSNELILVEPDERSSSVF